MPTYNRPGALDRTLDALSALEFPRDQFELIVVDSGSEHRATAEISARHRARYVRQLDLGVAASRNRGASEASGELLMFVDDDVIVGRDNLARHDAIHRQNPRCLVSGHWEFDERLRTQLALSALGRYRLAYEDAYNEPHGVEVAEDAGQVHPLTLAAGNLSLRASVFWSLDGFDEEFPVGAEDQDLTWRARRAGCTLIYDFGIRVVHNDQHRDLHALCMRQERAAVGTVFFARKHPDAPAALMLELNGPLRRSDSPALILRKVVRGTLSRRPALVLGERLVALVERFRPEGGWPLETLYRALGGLYVFRGVRQGIHLQMGGARDGR